jgi:phage shock protein PspC (stress-responsive transcriptional regulator)
MSATMSYGSPLRQPARWIWGVCADLADRAAVPVWIPRAAFVVFAFLHCFLAGVLYVGLAYLLCPSKRAQNRCRPAPPRPNFAEAAFSTSNFATTDQRFRNLDQRLSDLEAATIDRESELRRAFRDLERRR